MNSLQLRDWNENFALPSIQKLFKACFSYLHSLCTCLYVHTEKHTFVLIIMMLKWDIAMSETNWEKSAFSGETYLYSCTNNITEKNE